MKYYKELIIKNAEIVMRGQNLDIVGRYLNKNKYHETRIFDYVNISKIIIDDIETSMGFFEVVYDDKAKFRTVFSSYNFLEDYVFNKSRMFKDINVNVIDNDAFSKMATALYQDIISVNSNINKEKLLEIVNGITFNGLDLKDYNENELFYEGENDEMRLVLHIKYLNRDVIFEFEFYNNDALIWTDRISYIDDKLTIEDIEDIISYFRIDRWKKPVFM